MNNEVQNSQRKNNSSSLNEKIISCYYVYHSCFVLELDDCYMMFDYWKHLPYETDHDIDFEELREEIKASNKPIYIFFSHAHNDHYNKVVFEWGFQNAYYILSKDIKLDSKEENIIFMRHKDSVDINNISISAFFSTDEGVAFLISMEDFSVFHSGDLHWWAWRDDTEEEAKNMETLFKKTIEMISEKACNGIDLAFFPVDKRLEENYHLGGEYFIEKLNPKIFVPMHFTEKFDSTTDFKKEFQSNFSKTLILTIEKENKKII